MENFRASNQIVYHKGFYNQSDPINSLRKILYQDFFPVPKDEEFPYTWACDLLMGSCHLFALALKQIFNYTPYIIEPNHKRGFHVFCEIYKNGQWYYIDARGITTSFNEFMEVAKIFVTDEYSIRPIEQSDIDKWNNDDNYVKEGKAFAEKVIKKYKAFYEL